VPTPSSHLHTHTHTPCLTRLCHDDPEATLHAVAAASAAHAGKDQQLARIGEEGQERCAEEGRRLQGEGQARQLDHREPNQGQFSRVAHRFRGGAI